MTVPATEFTPNEKLESVLREDLAQGDAFLGTATPLLRHFLINDDNSMFSDDIIARVRGMMGDLVHQFLDVLADEGANRLKSEHDEEITAAYAAAIADQPALLNHLHALALEWQLTERLEQRLSLDPVVSPLIQALIASPEPATSGLAMKLLAAQARHGQAQRRMKLPLTELPGDLFHGLLKAFSGIADAQGVPEATIQTAETALRSGYDEALGRLGLMSQAVLGMGPGAVAALSVSHAGIAMFVTALAHASGQSRTTAIYSTNDRQIARLALSLSAAGLKVHQVEEQLLSLHPDITLPEGYDRLNADEAAAILTSGTIPRA